MLLESRRVGFEEGDDRNPRTDDLMGKLDKILPTILASVVLSAGAWPGLAQQQPSPQRRQSAPRVARQPATQPQLLTQPRPTAPPAGVAPQAMMPAGFPLTAPDQARVDQILDYWEHHTSKIKTYQCKFIRENYDFVFGEKSKPKSIDVGTIRYNAPDKGLMRVDKTYDYNPKATDPKQRYVQQDVQFGEYWVCDGESVYQFDARTKVLTETKLAPDMRGKAIGDGPLPFLFGAKAETMKQRYWIREVTPKDNPQAEYFLEATPKRQEDAANFDRLLVRLAVDKEQLVPRAMQVDKKQAKVVYQFQDHTANDTLHRVQGFLDSFVRPKTPLGWTKVVEDWNGTPLDDRQAANPSSGSAASDATQRR
jgi:TIGR03009 family protein